MLNVAHEKAYGTAQRLIHEWLENQGIYEWISIDLVFATIIIFMALGQCLSGGFSHVLHFRGKISRRGIPIFQENSRMDYEF